ncbi:hypothetical protein ACFVH4_00210 [Nocardia ignorata]|uniref:Rv1733c family protein n=1 Tax=Nocardia ignorata TaxID=145285 RepID=UPI00363B3AF4
MTSTTFRIDALMSHALRSWRCRPWNSNPLMRWPDRLLATVRLISAIAVLISIPVAAAVGTVVYADDAARLRVERSQTTVVEALVLDRPHNTSLHIRVASAAWTGAEGTTVGTVRVGNRVEKGDRIQVWLNQSGEPTSAPRPPEGPVMNGIGVAAVIMVGTGFVAWCSNALTERLVAWRRKTIWDQQLSRLVG